MADKGSATGFKNENEGVTNETGMTEANRRYATAYTEHYTNQNLRLALQLYVQVIKLHPANLEAGYARAQIQNIVQAIVPQQELLDTGQSTAVCYFSRVVQYVPVMGSQICTRRDQQANDVFMAA